MFTGDRSGDFLYRAMFEAGFANQPTSVSADDGLTLRDAYITAPAHCVPPDNKPSLEELAQCRPYLLEELALLSQVQVVVALGRIAFDTYLSVLKEAGKITSRASFSFSHGANWITYEGGPVLLASYHPSQQNTSTGKLTAAMLRDVFLRAQELISAKTHTVGGAGGE